MLVNLFNFLCKPLVLWLAHMLRTLWVFIWNLLEFKVNFCIDYGVAWIYLQTKVRLQMWDIRYKSTAWSVWVISMLSSSFSLSVITGIKSSFGLYSVWNASESEFQNYEGVMNTENGLMVSWPFILNLMLYFNMHASLFRLMWHWYMSKYYFSIFRTDCIWVASQVRSLKSHH